MTFPVLRIVVLLGVNRRLHRAAMPKNRVRARTGCRLHAHWEPYHTFFREGSEIKWLRSETFLFWRAAGAKNFCPGDPK